MTGDLRSQPNTAELADAGLRHADGLSAKLALPDWKPGRSHIEQSRNSIQKLAEALSSHATLTARVEEMEKALRFYADGKRYGGPNQRRVDNDPWTKDDAAYMKDVTRDGGSIARAVLQPKGAAV